MAPARGRRVPRIASHDHKQTVSLSSDGTWIAFRTTAALDPVDTTNPFFNNIYVVFYSRNRLTLGEPQLVSQHPDGLGVPKETPLGLNYPLKPSKILSWPQICLN